MKEMIKRVRDEKGGFTLAELLIVVAIILVLVAIAIPVFTGALNNANQAVADANARSVKAVGTTEILLGEDDLGTTGPWKVTANVDDQGNISDLKVATATASDTEVIPDKGVGAFTVIVTAADVS